MRRLVALGVVGTAADALTTWVALQVALAHGFVFTELNPAIATAMTVLGPSVALAVRTLLGVVLFAFLGWGSRRSRYGTRPLAVAAVFTWAVVAWNCATLLRAV